MVQVARRASGTSAVSRKEKPRLAPGLLEAAPTGGWGDDGAAPAIMGEEPRHGPFYLGAVPLRL
jgi:hypothetical protein